MGESVILSAEKLSLYPTRISLIGALYRAVDAGLRSDKDPESAAETEMLSLASSPGLDIVGPDVYAVAVHHAKLAAILSACLRSVLPEPWKVVPDVGLGPDVWRSACYDTGDGMRRIVLVNRWDERRKRHELTGWRTLGEVCVLNRPLRLTSIVIGAARGNRRYSPWSMCYRHPRNRAYRMRRAEGEFGTEWEKEWREDSGVGTKDWLDQMSKDGCMDLVQTVDVPVPFRRQDYLDQMALAVREMDSLD